MRVGQGFDVHALVEGRKLIIGGVEIPYQLGLAGHSDADVLLHAICDALLGAAGLGDIGRHFPDSDPRFKGIDSRHLLRESRCVCSRSRAIAWSIVDATIIAQAPKMAPHIRADGGAISPPTLAWNELRQRQGDHHRKTGLYRTRRGDCGAGGVPADARL